MNDPVDVSNITNTVADAALEYLQIPSNAPVEINESFPIDGLPAPVRGIILGDIPLSLLANPTFSLPITVTGDLLFVNSYLKVEYAFSPVSQVPVPGTVWLFGSALIGLMGVSNRKKTS